MVSKGKEKSKVLLCNDREHILFYVEMGCLEFCPYHSRIKSIDAPDYIILALDFPDVEGSKSMDAITAVGVILKGLQLPSFLKTDGRSGLHVYIPLDSKGTFETSRKVSEYIGKLIALKIPDLIALEGYVYGKVSLDISINNEGATVVAPYSLVAGETAAIATPLPWNEVGVSTVRGLEAKTPLVLGEKIFKRLKQEGDLFDALFKMKVNADRLLDRLEKDYAFLFS